MGACSVSIAVVQGNAYTIIASYIAGDWLTLHVYTKQKSYYI